MSLDKIKMLIADDHQLFREGLINLINRYEDVIVAEEAKNGNQALALALNSDIDVVMLDINMPEMTGIEVKRRIDPYKPDLPFIALTMHNDPSFIKDAFTNGFSGYLLKDSSINELHQAIIEVYNGKRFISQDLKDLAVERFVTPVNQFSDVIDLSERELEILHLILKEFSNQEIATELNISVRTVETHKRNLIAKTGSKNIVGLILFAIKNQIIK